MLTVREAYHFCPAWEAGEPLVTIDGKVRRFYSVANHPPLSVIALEELVALLH
jgi:hypothetical protein